MAAPAVRIQEVDLSQMVPGFPGVYGAIVIGAPKGDISVPRLITTDSALLREFTIGDTVKIGDSTSFFSALAFLQKSNRLWVARAVGENYRYGGVVVVTTSATGAGNGFFRTTAAGTTAVGEFETSTHNWETSGWLNQAFTLFGKNPGAWNDTIGVTVTVPRSEDFVHGSAVRTNSTIGTNQNSIVFDSTKNDWQSGELVKVAPLRFDSIPRIVINRPTDATAALAVTRDAKCEAVIEGGRLTAITVIDPGAGYSTAALGDGRLYPTISIEGGSPQGVLAGHYALMMPSGGKAVINLGLQSADRASGSPDFSPRLNMVAGTVSSVILSTRGTLAIPSLKTRPTQATEDQRVYAVSPDASFYVRKIAGQSRVHLTDSLASSLLVDDPPTGVFYLELPQETVSPASQVNSGFYLTGLGLAWSQGMVVNVSGVLPAGNDSTAGLVTGTDYVLIKAAGSNFAKLALVTTPNTPLFLVASSGDMTLTVQPISVGLKLVPAIKVKDPTTFQVNVYRKGDENSVLESHTCSLDITKRDGFNRVLALDKVLESSAFIGGLINPVTSGTTRIKAQPSVLYFGGGSDGDPITEKEMVNAASKFLNKSAYPVTVLMDGGYATVGYQKKLLEIAETRKDCVATLSVPRETEVSSNYLNDIANYRNNVLNGNSSYGAIYSPHVKVLDRFNGRTIDVAPDGYAAAAIANTAVNFEMWFPVGGLRRGLLNVSDVLRRFSDGEMDFLYDNGINPIRFYPGKGIMIWGQKTLKKDPSALDRFNVRLLLIVLEPAIEAVLESFLFELNDEATRTQAAALVDDYLRDIKARRGVYDYRVVCDDSNNSAQDIDNYRMNMWIFIQPVRGVEEIPVKVVLTATGADFNVAQQAV